MYLRLLKPKKQRQTESMTWSLRIPENLVVFVVKSFGGTPSFHPQKIHSPLENHLINIALVAIFNSLINFLGKDAAKNETSHTNKIARAVFAQRTQ